MENIEPGATILIPISVGQGAFPAERLISFEAEDGQISGFVQVSQIIDVEGSPFLEARVLEIAAEKIAVKVHGSFFTTTGLAYIPRTDGIRLVA